MRPFLLASLCALSVHAAAALAGEDCTEDAMVVFDGSGSMVEMGFNRLDEPRIIEARRAMHDAIPGAAKLRRLGLVTYGPGSGPACDNVSLRFPPMAGAAHRMLSYIDGLEPAGETPLTASIRLAADVLDYRNRPGTIVLVTDGKETCGGAPCQLAAELAADGAGLTVHVIGFKVRGEHFSYTPDGSDYTEASSVARCLADRTGGQYFPAENAEELIAALRVTLGCPIYGDATPLVR